MSTDVFAHPICFPHGRVSWNIAKLPGAGAIDNSHCKASEYATPAASTLPSVGAKRVPPAHSTAKCVCKHTHLARCSRKSVSMYIQIFQYPLDGPFSIFTRKTMSGSRQNHKPCRIISLNRFF